MRIERRRRADDRRAQARAVPAQAPCSRLAGASAETGRSLVPVRPQAQAAPAAARPSALFLAHLIAVAQQVPQTRQRRRAEPAEASAIYAGASTRAADTGQAISRSS